MGLLSENRRWTSIYMNIGNASVYVKKRLTVNSRYRGVPPSHRDSIRIQGRLLADWLSSFERKALFHTITIPKRHYSQIYTQQESRLSARRFSLGEPGPLVTMFGVGHRSSDILPQLALTPMTGPPPSCNHYNIRGDFRGARPLENKRKF